MRERRPEPAPGAEEPPDAGADYGDPRDIPLSGWRGIARRLWTEQCENGLWVAAAGVAFYAMLALLPGLGFLMLTVGMTNGPEAVKEQFGQLDGVLPQESLNATVDQFTAMLEVTRGTLRWGAGGSLMLTLWSLWFGMRALIAALNLAYRERERRGFLKLNGLSILLGIGGLVFIPVSFGLFVKAPALADFLELPVWLVWLVQIGRWPLLVAMILTALAVLYRVGPSRAEPKWRWVSWGAVIATALWIGASALFSLYVRTLADYQSAYGMAGALITLMIWLNLVAYAILFGAALNAEIEQQTSRDVRAGSGRLMR
ncbi:YihY/virulence factor BrkB family protein [Azospirillum sp. SYSU D00513]|uniref:YihY/virulence factor BrkB family protein n=1 Tax=Azospirillum sp. SYSU D00513 TaxID=2812561 RepID=UPI001A968200|nr:YihY/virulence factor BrkB family protein [Azospirillum sp. SYSU D00513]